MYFHLAATEVCVVFKKLTSQKIKSVCNRSHTHRKTYNSDLLPHKIINNSYENVKIENTLLPKIKTIPVQLLLFDFVWYAVIITFFKDDVKDKMNIVRKLTMAIGKANIRYKKCGKISLTA